MVDFFAGEFRVEREGDGGIGDLFGDWIVAGLVSVFFAVEFHQVDGSEVHGDADLAFLDLV